MMGAAKRWKYTYTGLMIYGMVIMLGTNAEGVIEIGVFGMLLGLGAALIATGLDAGVAQTRR